MIWFSVTEKQTKKKHIILNRNFCEKIENIYSNNNQSQFNIIIQNIHLQNSATDQSEWSITVNHAINLNKMLFFLIRGWLLLEIVYLKRF